MLSGALSIFLSLVYNILRLTGYLLSRWDTFNHYSKLKRKYRRARKVVDNGKVEGINDILTGKKD